MPLRGTSLADAAAERAPANSWSRPMPIRCAQASNQPLTPEEDTLDDPDETAEAIDDTLPADLWFMIGRPQLPCLTAVATTRTRAP